MCASDSLVTTHLTKALILQDSEQYTIRRAPLSTLVRPWQSLILNRTPPKSFRAEELDPAPVLGFQDCESPPDPSKEPSLFPTLSSAR